MKLIRYSVHTGSENMKIDSDLLDECIENRVKEPIFRLYGWNPMCISLGRNQKEHFQVQNIDVVRRITGGRALLHDNEITYSFVAPISEIPNGENVAGSYKYISGILIEFFRTIGIQLDFGGSKKVSAKNDYCMLISTGADVCFNGKKLIGSAQCRKNGYILQHGSILFDYDKCFLENLFNEKIEGITSVKEVLPKFEKKYLVEKLEDFIQNY